MENQTRFLPSCTACEALLRVSQKVHAAPGRAAVRLSRVSGPSKATGRATVGRQGGGAAAAACLPARYLRGVEPAPQLSDTPKLDMSGAPRPTGQGLAIAAPPTPIPFDAVLPAADPLRRRSVVGALTTSRIRRRRHCRRDETVRRRRPPAPCLGVGQGGGFRRLPTSGQPATLRLRRLLQLGR